MNWTWAGSIEQLWHAPGFPMWLAMGAAGLFGLVVLVALLRADKSVANAALAMIALLAIGAAATVFLRHGPAETAAPRGTGGGEIASLMQQPALACVDDLAGETVLAACEKLLFSSPDTVAAAVSYTSSRISRLLAAGDVETANKAMTPELDRLRRSIERDRYGLVAYVLASRDRCQPGECAAYLSLTDHNLIAANMDEKLYESQIQRYSPAWNAVPAAAAAAPPFAALAPSMPTGKPTNAEFPTSASIPPVNIMTPEPPAAAAKPAPTAAADKPAPVAPARPAQAAAQASPKPAPKPPANANAQAVTRAVPPPTVTRPQPPPKPKPPLAAPVQLAPAAANAEE
uniref:Uncharacterized protein n=1 Tax=Rhodopseudomonas palustris (strain BisA53) TaxID=316055 RepID=Q07L37_RHOP5